MNMQDKIRDTIRRTAREDGFGVDRILLFGSRARGEDHSSSDWDILVVLTGDVSVLQKRSLAGKIRRNLRDVPIDLIVKTLTELSEYKDFYGTVTREALKEGVTL